jgi:hypothetical protein
VKAVRETYLGDSALALVVMVVLIAPLALAAAVIDPRRERAQLRYGFAHVPHTGAQMLAILGSNLTVLLVFLVMAVLVQSRRACRTTRGRRVYVGYCDLIVILPVLHNLVLAIGTGVGAYGWRMVIAMLPAGPLELAAYALAASVYLRSRRTQFSPREIETPTAVAALSVALLAVAAGVETFG